jgi:hypothetical protein
MNFTNCGQRKASLQPKCLIKINEKFKTHEKRKLRSSDANVLVATRQSSLHPLRKNAR